MKEENKLLLDALQLDITLLNKDENKFNILIEQENKNISNLKQVKKQIEERIKKEVLINEL
jgi:hypothetical protein